MKHRKVMGFIVATAMSLLLVACGSDKKKEVVDIGITPGTKTITMGQQTTFAVTTTNTDYSLSTDKAAAGCVKTNATTVTCTPTASGEYVVTVTATADKNKTKTATLVVNEVIITITPETATVDIKQSVPFTVDADFTLSADDAAGCVKTNATTVTCTPTASGEYEVTVTATADANKTKKAILVVNPVVITIEPEAATIEAKQSVTFTVDTDFTVDADDAAGCVKTNPTTVTCTPTVLGEYVVTVTATADTTKTKTATLTVTPQEIAGYAFVEAGSFEMGCPDSAEVGMYVCSSTTKPVHSVTLTKDFYIGKYEITQKEWKDVMGTNPSVVKEYPKGTLNENLPVTNISWNEIQTFIAKLNEDSAATGRTYRLPTEAEWEWAARGVTSGHGYRWSGTDTDGTAGNALGGYSWYYSNSDQDKDGNPLNPKTKTPHPVGEKSPNELGIYDMLGNVSEFCSDFHWNSYDWESEGTESLPGFQGPEVDWLGLSNRVRRGGSWSNIPTLMMVWERSSFSSTLTTNPLNNEIGFRLVLELTPQTVAPTSVKSASSSTTGLWDSITK